MQQQQNLLTLIKITNNNKKHPKALYRCECGNEKKIFIGNVNRGLTISCGCVRKRKSRERVYANVLGTLDKGLNNHNYKHGMSNKTSEYNTWMNIKSRCLNKNNKAFRNYGNRGIVICEEWLNSFEQFYKDMGKKPSPKHTIERIYNNKGYCKENCVWATKDTQAKNKRSNRYITFNGKTQILMDWQRETGLDHRTISSRLDRFGWSIEKTLTTTSRKYNGK